MNNPNQQQNQQPGQGGQQGDQKHGQGGQQQEGEQRPGRSPASKTNSRASPASRAIRSPAKVDSTEVPIVSSSREPAIRRGFFSAILKASDRFNDG